MIDLGKDEKLSASVQNRLPSAANRLIALFGKLSCLAVGLFTLASWFARWDWRLDLLTSFRWQYAFCALLAALSCLLIRNWKVASIGALLAGVNIFDGFSPRVEIPKPINQIRAVTANVYFANPQADRFIEFVCRSSPDIFAVNELSQGWAAKLQVLHEEYPYQVVEARNDPFGIGLYSRWPLVDPQLVEVEGTGFPMVVASVDRPAGRIQIIAAHPPPPNSERAAAYRNQQLQTLCRLAQESNIPTLVLGDLNITPWSPYFKDLLRHSGLKSSERRLIPRSTWQRESLIFSIPIDYVLISEQFDVLDCQVGPDIGSDHRPLWVSLSRRP